ncbi:hypothetical protein [Roseovarius indicus]
MATHFCNGDQFNSGQTDVADAPVIESCDARNQLHETSTAGQHD